MNKQKNNLNQPLNIKNNKYKENSKENKSLGSSTYSKNKKVLDQMLREYQSFCKKYFGESTPIGSMTEERMNRLLEEQNNCASQKKQNNLLQKENNNDKFFDILKENEKESEEFFLGKKNILDEIPDDLPFSENNRLGKHKNSKNDYIRRNNNIFNEKEQIKEKEKADEKNRKKKEKEEKEKMEEEEEKEEKMNGEDEYDDFENEENLEEIRTEKAKIIQKVFRNKKIKNKEKIYCGYDKPKKHLLWIFVDKSEIKNGIKTIIIKCFNINQNNVFTINQNINDLLNLEFISKEELEKNLENFIDKIDKILQKNEKKINNEINKKKGDEEKVLDDDGEEYTF